MKAQALALLFGVGAALSSAPAASAPQSGSAADRPQILAALTVILEKDLGAPVHLATKYVRIGGGYAFLEVLPRRLNGQAFRIQRPDWMDAYDQALFQKRQGHWILVENRLGPTDVWQCKYAGRVPGVVLGEGCGAPPVAGQGYSYLVGLDPYGDNWLALRSEPSVTYGQRLMKMGPETLLTVIGRQGAWVRVRLTTGETGWALARYVACCR